MSKKNQSSRKRRTPIAAAKIAGIGQLALVRYGTQFYMTVNGAKLESVRTVGSARRMFKEAAVAMGRKKVSA